MKNWNAKNLPFVAAGLGVLGAAVRWVLYAVAVDERLLLPKNHPLEWLLMALTVAAGALIAAGVWKLDGSAAYRHNFAASPGAALGAAAAAVGILVTVLMGEAPRAGMFEPFWKVLGLLAVPCLLWISYCRLKGGRPFFLFYVEVCVFLAFHILNNYQYWSGIPQTLDFVYSLLGCVALTLFAYYQAAFAVGSGKRRMQLFMGMFGGFLSIVALSGTDYWLLYCGCAIWALTNLCSFTPVPKPKKEKKPQKESEPENGTA